MAHWAPTTNGFLQGPSTSDRVNHRNTINPHTIATLERRPPSAQEPPRKRLRLSGQWRSREDIPERVHLLLDQCLQKQIFPHVDAEVEKLRRDKIDVDRLATEAVGVLTGEEFTNEFLLKGYISLDLEANIASRARKLVRDWSKLPGFQAKPQPDPSTHEKPRETPVPVPYIQRHQPQATRPAGSPASIPRNARHTAVSSHTAVRRISESAIPIPRVPLSTQLPSTPLPKHTSTPATSTPVVIDLVSNSSSPQSSPPSAPDPLPDLPGDLSELQPRTPQPNTQDGRVASHRRTPSPDGSGPSSHQLASQRAIQAADTQKTSQWFSLDRRPYITGPERRYFTRGSRNPVRLGPSTLSEPHVFHVDFTPDEIYYLCQLSREALGLSPDTGIKKAQSSLAKLVKKHTETLVRKLPFRLSHGHSISGRTNADVQAFLTDLLNADTSRGRNVFSLQRIDSRQQWSVAQSSRVDALLFAREVVGHRGYGAMRKPTPFLGEFKKCREDAMELRHEWTNCAGDIATITWVSNDGFLCGTTEHSDSHNQQYNKPGNLVLGSCSSYRVQAYPQHRVVRPIVQQGENSTAAMRESQDPWLYTSVVSSDYDPVHDRAFTSSFDRTVRIWKAEPDGSSMALLGTWPHQGNVNFVVASKHGTAMVATASDVPQAAVRIYHVNSQDISNSPFHPYSCSRILDLEGNVVHTEKWGYFPATVRWGLSPTVRHLLLVGYSPRSLTNDDNDIPEDRRHSGELCLWDGLTGERWKVIGAATQNVFEVLWHPSQPSFIAATSPHDPSAVNAHTNARTQIRIFRLSDNVEHAGKAYTAVQVLDCEAIDINELSILPNSFTYSYITAGCTDGNVYVWDTARGDKPVHVLRHGDPVEEFNGDREREDTGVKFTAWGNSPDRFYTGSSDGVVKVWNVRSGRKPLVRNLLEVPAPVSFGMFSPNSSRLVIGDASGRIFLLSVDEEDQAPAAVSVPLPLQMRMSRGRRAGPPTSIIRHPTPDPPSFDARGDPVVEETGRGRARAYVESGQIVLSRRWSIGPVQGPNYAETGLFRPEAHADDDPSKPLLASYEAQQRQSLRMFPKSRRHMFKPLRDPNKGTAPVAELHRQNVAADLDVANLPEDTKLALQMARVDLDDVGMPYDFDYEEMLYDG